MSRAQSEEALHPFASDRRLVNDSEASTRMHLSHEFVAPSRKAEPPLAKRQTSSLVLHVQSACFRPCHGLRLLPESARME
jgi:hypothetical protein